MQKYFLKSVQISLIFVYLVILAGAIVRMTGSGMGCPDWPKCFGYYIPPTQEKQLLFTSNKKYQKGQVIIKDEALMVVKKNFTLSNVYNSNNWEKYSKHDYAVFNPLHTWVEYINRLFGALAGIACFAAFIFSFGFWKENKKLIYLSLIVCVLMGFQAWLGKTVVDSVLNPIKITTHMLVALLIVGIQIFILKNVSTKNNILIKNKKFNILIGVVLIFTIIQVIFGTNVRELVDSVSKTGLPKEFWLENPTFSFYFHRTFSILIFLLNGYLFYLNQKFKLGFQKINWIMLLISLEIFSGILMYYFDFPFGSQTVHLFLATMLFGYQFYIFLETKQKL